MLTFLEKLVIAHLEIYLSGLRKDLKKLRNLREEKKSRPGQCVLSATPVLITVHTLLFMPLGEQVSDQELGQFQSLWSSGSGKWIVEPDLNVFKRSS